MESTEQMIEKMTPEELGDFISKIGSAQVWSHLGKAVKDEEIDGGTLLSLSLEKLSVLFNKPFHAERVYQLIHTPKVENKNNDHQLKKEIMEEKKEEKTLCEHGKAATMVTKDGKKVMCPDICSLTPSNDRISFADFENGKKGEIKTLQMLFQNKIKLLSDNNQSLVEDRDSHKVYLEDQLKKDINELIQENAEINEKLNRLFEEEVKNNENEAEVYCKRQITFEEIFTSPSPDRFYQNYIRYLGPDFNFENAKKEINSNFFQKRNINGCFIAIVNDYGSPSFTTKYYCVIDNNGKIIINDWDENKISVSENRKITPVSSAYEPKKAVSKSVVPDNRKSSFHFSVDYSSKCALAVIFCIDKKSEMVSPSLVGIKISEDGYKAVDGKDEVILPVKDLSFRLEFDNDTQKFSLSSSAGVLIYTYKFTLSKGEYFYPEVRFNCKSADIISHKYYYAKQNLPDCLCCSNSVTLL